MPLDTVVSIAYKNSWDGSQGPMHTSFITFASGLAGEANHKQPTPPYRVGEVVEYQITGEFRGTNKLKVGKPKEGQQGGYQQAPQSSPPPARQNAGNGQQSGFHGASVGCSIVQACEFARSLNKGFDKAFIYETASALLRLSQKLEMGQLAPLVGQPAPQPQPAPPPPQPAPPPQRPRGGPDGSAFQYGQSGGHAGPGDIDEDVPFAPITI